MKSRLRHVGPIRPRFESQTWCRCPVCGNSVDRRRGFPCNNMRCSMCGAYMVRE